MNTKESQYLSKLGARIKALREERGIDQKQFAFECGISRTQLYMIEKGEANPRVLTLKKIAEGLEVDLGKVIV